ncbi:glycosyltransferase family 2 protein [Actinomycetospora rhizophila]|uniref:Glycosyltransferase family 2 protein n=1 Tax=Actinomycetospora rhizophila TaxID=1416876 RepID=A0ABV9Z8Y4_9PSEU
MTLLAERPPDEVDESELVVGRRIQEFSQLAGPIREPDPADGPYRVAYRGVDAVHGRGRVARSLLVAGLNFAFEALFFLWLLHPSHRPPVIGSDFAIYANWVVIGSIGLMELLRLINVLSLSLASVIARDPVPVPPEPDRRIAFLTTIVPSKEPIDVVRGTLQAALRIQYDGILDVWILDEGDDDEVKAMCRELGVNHFTRKGIGKYNQRKGAFKAKTKHGNYNAWVAEHGDSYEVFLSVDPDHVPLPNYAERILGYFRDPDVAYVVGPQCYANDETFVTRAAESQQFPFHSLIQRAANRYNAAMLVGTNNAIRISALQGIGGLSDSITEDMATGLKFHTRRNPASRRRWKSVYTPDVLAVGEGPSSWGDFFSQQMRWSRGTFEVLLKEMWLRLPRLSPGRALHYILITTFYPSMAIGWVLGAVNACLFLALGVQGVVVPVQLWLALYIDATAFQLWVYLRNRRYNVSPYEAEGSSGVKGMLMSIFAAPIFAASLIATMLRLPARFVVTPKGLSSSADHILTFRRHLQWAALLIGAIVLAIIQGYATPAVLLWPAVALASCLAPPILCLVERIVGRQPAIESAPVLADGRSGVTTESLERAALDALLAAGSATRRSPRADSEPAAVPAGAAALEGDLPPGWVRTSSLASRQRDAAPSPAPRPARHEERPTPGRRRAPEDGRGVDPAPSPGPRDRRRPAAPAAGQQPGQPGPSPAPRPTPHPGAAPQPGQPGQHQPGQHQPGQPGQHQPGQPGPRPTGRPPVPGAVPPPPAPTPPGSRPRPTPTPRPAPSPFAAPGQRPGERPGDRPADRPAAAEQGGRYVAPAAEHQGPPRPGAPRPEARPDGATGRPTPPSPTPTPSPTPRPDETRTRGPRPGPRREHPPMLLSSAAELDADGGQPVIPVSAGSSISNESAKRHDGRDGGTRASDAVSVNAPTVAVRVVALAAVAGPAERSGAGVPPDLEGRRTEAS